MLIMIYLKKILKILFYIVDDSGRVDDSKTNDETAVPLKPCDLCAVATQHPCRKCGIPVCNLACSIQDPTSENELHRTHKPGYSRYVRVIHYTYERIHSIQLPKIRKPIQRCTSFQ